MGDSVLQSETNLSDRTFFQLETPGFIGSYSI